MLDNIANSINFSIEKNAILVLAAQIVCMTKIGKNLRIE